MVDKSPGRALFFEVSFALLILALLESKRPNPTRKTKRSIQQDLYLQKMLSRWKIWNESLGRKFQGKSCSRPSAKSATWL